jgi:threonine synthase
MDVGNPSNFVRVLDMFDNDLDKLKTKLSGFSYTDEEIKSAINYVYNTHSYVVCPHTATGCLAVTSDKLINPDHEKTAYIILATAHPCKFPDVFKELRIRFDEPEQVASLYKKEKKSLEMRNNFEDFKEYLMG